MLRRGVHSLCYIDLRENICEVLVEEIERLIIGVEEIEFQSDEFQLDFVVQMSDCFEPIET